MYQGFVVASRAIVSTIGKVRSIFQQTNSLNKLLFRENYSHIVLYTEDGPVTYYPEKMVFLMSIGKKLLIIRMGL